MKDFVLTTDKITKRYGKNFQILTEGINTERFEKNPIMLFNHNHDNVIGTWTNLRIVDNKLIATPEFDDDDESQKIAKKVEKGTLKTASVGLELVDVTEDDANFIINKSNLYETSIVSIPQNDDAEALNFILLNSAGQPIELEQYIKNKKNNMENKQKPEVETIVNATEPEAIIENKVENKVETQDFKALNVELSLKLENSSKDIETLKTSITEKDSVINSLKEKLDIYEKEKFQNLLNKGVQEGKITNESTSAFENLSYEQTEKILSALKPITASLSAELNKHRTVDSKEKNYEWYLKNDTEELKRISIENPTHYKVLLENYKK